MSPRSGVVAHGFARSAIGAVDGELAGWHPVDLAAAVGAEALRRAGLGPDMVDEVIVGCSEPVGAQGGGMARATVLAGGWPPRVGGTVVDRAESSGATALHLAAAMVQAGSVERVLVMGAGVASTVPPGASALNRTYGAPWGSVVSDDRSEEGILPPPRLAERAALAAGLHRDVLDEWAERSRERRARATSSTAVVEVGARPGDAALLTRTGDPVIGDAVRDWGTASELDPAFDTDGLLTAATFAPPADGIAAFVVEAAPVASPAPSVLAIRGTGRSAGEASDPLGGLARAVRDASAAAGADSSEIGMIEIVESTAVVPVLATLALGWDDEHVNSTGGTLATGDAGAAEELRLVCDAAARLAEGELLLTVSAGPTGSAATLWSRAEARGA